MSSKTIRRKLLCNNVINLSDADTVNLKSTEAWGHTYHITKVNQIIILPLAEAGMNMTFFSNMTFGADPAGTGTIANSSSALIGCIAESQDIITGPGATTLTSAWLPINANTGYDTRVHQFICFTDGVWTPVQRITTNKEPTPPP